ncbi:hypothetical protein HMPREF3222_01130 [Clostridium perfringens]|uniref:Uncharacterized protein n=1 Tax=Clostridium perfringens TaxID=1502 RepID=A0A133N971_CLOPF|nr:hypothetical protein HMPREF3222_01130 [Clostridium perfringens]
MTNLNLFIKAPKNHYTIIYTLVYLVIMTLKKLCLMSIALFAFIYF